MKKQKNTWSTIKGVLLGVVGLCAVTAVGAFAVQASPIQTTPNTPSTNQPSNPTPENPNANYAEVGFGTQFASVYFYDAANNPVDSNKLIVGQNYTLEIAAFEGYVVQDWWIDFCDGNMYQSNINFFTATEQMYIAVNACEYIAPVTATMTSNFPEQILYFQSVQTGIQYTMSPNGTCQLTPGDTIQFMQPDYQYTIDSIVVDGNYILMGGMAGQDFSNVNFVVPSYDFAIQATCGHLPATYSIVYDGTACTSMNITDTTGEFIPATYETGYDYGLKFQAPEGVYVTEIYLNGELIKVYEAGGIASGIAVFNSNATEWNFRIVTTGSANTTTYATVNATYDSSAIRLSFQNQYGGTQNINELVVGQEYMYFINIIGDGVSLESVTLNGTTNTFMQGSFVATETIDITITHIVN